MKNYCKTCFGYKSGDALGLPDLLQVDPGAFWCQVFFGKRTPDAFFNKLLDIIVKGILGRIEHTIE